ncbi:hypothetical protein ARMGADRAFT_1075023 [Armillaria gallica]|uniref:Uncharacterized protein n=1 Tax=Armillaria gallica TaxID=47427 RepID=A0A2H3DSG2_ARMGA|nr:hypothetical protein ARMGADRAFT_1075023 [Armillaria gallica]
MTYHIAGIVYYGTNHFTTRFINLDNNVWFNNGMIQGRNASMESTLDKVDLMHDMMVLSLGMSTVPIYITVI